jgi:DNA-binding MarR family transcriptional regulator
MKTKKTSDQIINYIIKHAEASGEELSRFLGITTRAVRKQLKKLFEENKVVKLGRPPKVFYKIKPVGKKLQNIKLDVNLEKFLNLNYIFISPAGEIKRGVEGFSFWCQKKSLPFIKTANEYFQTLKKYDKFKKNGLIDGYNKFKATFEKVYLDQVFYLDFYSIDRFGKTKLGQELLYAKQSQDRNLISSLVKDIKPAIEKLIKKYKIAAVGFIPPTVKREVQFMRELEKNLKLPIKTLKISKIKTQVAVAQKTLTRLEDRIENAGHTIIVEDTGEYNNVLLIDDAVGSGATLNETARQIKNKKIAKGKIIGLAITGSYKGFDVISEV